MKCLIKRTFIYIHSLKFVTNLYTFKIYRQSLVTAGLVNFVIIHIHFIGQCLDTMIFFQMFKE